MSTIAAIGEARLLDGYALAGVSVLAAEGADAQRAAWNRLEPGVGLVLLTDESRRSLEDVLDDRSDLLWIVVSP